MPAPDSVRRLVATFDTHFAHYKSNAYNETQTRREFLDPLFKALGWDIDNSAGIAANFKDVIHEDAIKIGDFLKAPDYCFRHSGSRKFFLEAKKPSTDVKTGIQPAFQLRRYAWSAKLSLSILSDFEEFAFYDTRIKPASNDKASTARLFYCNYKEYEEKWDEIASIFSRDAVANGSFEKFSESTRKKKGTTEVDEAFLAEIEHWRELLAKNFALRNSSLSVRDLNFAVQKTIDRIVFLRMCEDRGTEDYGRLKEASKVAGIYKNLGDLFKLADARYNSGLFHFKDNQANSDAFDSLTPDLALDDKPLKEIIKNLYYPDSPYEFSVLPADILGQVYERFLGKTISLNAKHQAKIEEKPEIRKAGGVYYTPTYVVEWIVEHTLGRLLNGPNPKKPTPISVSKAANLSVLDPACGSGSFLIVAYQYLLDWHLNRYLEKIETYTKGAIPKIHQSKGGVYKLTTSERKRILLNSIFGVDIDRQAVEVTKLSLLLKVLEGETEQVIQRDWLKERQRILPNLGNNIRCGNSLIAPDFYESAQMQLLDEEAEFRLNVFDWNSFPQAKSGFDCVIGNPPYLYSAGQEYADYFTTRYMLGEYQTDFYVYFSEKAISLTKIHGFHSFIVTDSWLNSERIQKLRNELLSKKLLYQIAIFDYPVFRDANIENAIYVATPGKPNKTFDVFRFSSPSTPVIDNTLDPKRAQALNLIDPKYSEAKSRLVDKLEKHTVSLGSLVSLNRGLHAYRTDGYGTSKFKSGHQTKRDKEEQSYHADKKLDSSYLPEVKGRNVSRFAWQEGGRYVSYGNWLAEPRTSEFFYSDKIVLRKVLGTKLSGARIEAPVALDQSLYIAIGNESTGNYSLSYFLGILCSSIGAFYLRNKHSIHDNLFPWYTKKHLAAFPIHRIDFEDKLDAKKHDDIANLADKIGHLRRQASLAKNPDTRRHNLAMAETNDRLLDMAVFSLYGISSDELGLFT